MLAGGPDLNGDGSEGLPQEDPRATTISTGGTRERENTQLLKHERFAA